MSVQYKAVLRPEPGIAGGGKKKYHAQIVRGEKIDVRSFAEAIAEAQLTNTTQVFGILEAFFKEFNRYLAEGRTLDLSPLGLFTPHLNSQGVDVPNAVNDQTITDFRVTFRPSTELKKQMKKVEFKKVEK